MTLAEAKHIVDSANEEFGMPMASLRDAASYRSRLLNVKQSAVYMEAKRMLLEAAEAAIDEKKGA